MNSNIEKVAISTPDLNHERREQLRELFPDAWTENGIDFDKLRAALGDLSDERSERYLFSWAGKRESLQLLQAPCRATLHPAPDESINWNETQNLYIEGDNLEALKLLYKPLFGRVKMIYIDPPYNTGNDFIYPDNFADALKNYLIQTGQKDPNGDLQTSNPDMNGHIHSRWLSMMYPRLFLARQLLKDDGVIFVSIDANEVHHLRMLMNEVFGTENFRNCIVVKRGIKNVQSQFEEVQSLSDGHEYILLYSRSFQHKLPKLNKSHKNQAAGKWDTFWRGTDRPTMRYEIFGQHPENGQWRWEKTRTLEAIENYESYLKISESDNVGLDDYYMDCLSSNNDKIDFVRLSASGVVQYYVPPKDSKLLSDNWMDITLSGSHALFDNPKNPELIARMARWITEGNDIVLDFFSGSGTTAQAVLELNREDGGRRRFVMVQLPEKTDNQEFPTIAEIGKERIRRTIDRIREQNSLDTDEAPEDLGFKVWKLGESNFRQLQPTSPNDTAAYLEQLEMMNDALLPDSKPQSVLYEVALREGFGLNARIESVPDVASVWQITDSEKGQKFFISLEGTVELEALRPLNLKADDLFICRGIALDDTTAANLALQCRLKMI